MSLLIGVAVLADALLAMQTISRPFEPSPVIRILEENLIIIGWVANWRSIEIFLYDFCHWCAGAILPALGRGKCRIATPMGKPGKKGLLELGDALE